MILFGLVCFRENYNESITFIDLYNSYIESKISDKRLDIFIFDNTDLNNWEISYNAKKLNNISLHYFHDVTNPGISYAYNKIAEYAVKNGFSHIVFLDQDTHLPIDFYDQYCNSILGNNIQIAAPIIMNGDHIFSPSKYRNYRSINLRAVNEFQLDLRNHTCINSGLLIHTSLFFQSGGYNNDLRLDFCDHEFIRRVSKYADKLVVLPVKLKQSFSTEVNSLDKAVFRYKIFLKDLLSLKKINNSGSKLFFFIDLPHLIRLTLQYKTFKFIGIRIRI
jgi:GT2 family glycosyltransferase